MRIRWKDQQQMGWKLLDSQIQGLGDGEMGREKSTETTMPDSALESPAEPCQSNRYKRNGEAIRNSSKSDERTFKEIRGERLPFEVCTEQELRELSSSLFDVVDCCWLELGGGSLPQIFESSVLVWKFAKRIARNFWKLLSIQLRGALLHGNHPTESHIKGPTKP